MPRSAVRTRAFLNATSVSSLLFMAVYGPLATLKAAPKLVETNRTLAQNPQAFEPASELGRFATRSGIRTSADGEPTRFVTRRGVGFLRANWRWGRT